MNRFSRRKYWPDYHALRVELSVRHHQRIYRPVAQSAGTGDIATADALKRQSNSACGAMRRSCEAPAKDGGDDPGNSRICKDQRRHQSSEYPNTESHKTPVTTIANTLDGLMSTPITV
jgi:hypothetical protein